VDRTRAQEPLLKPFMQNAHTVQIDSMNPYSLKGVIEKVNQGIPLLIFPEGRITRTGGIMKIYEGTGFAAYKTGACILPVYLKKRLLDNILTKTGEEEFLRPDNGDHRKDARAYRRRRAAAPKAKKGSGQAYLQTPVRYLLRGPQQTFHIGPRICKDL